MRMRSSRARPACVALVLACSLPPPAQAGDFFSNLFGGFRRPSAPSHRVAMPFDSDDSDETSAAHAPRRGRVMAAARPGACAPATAATSRPRGRTNRAAGLRATASAPPATPKWSMAATSIMPPRLPANPIANCRTPSAIAPRRWRLHLQRQGSGGACDHSSRERSDVAQGRHRRRCRRAHGRQSRRRQARGSRISRRCRTRCVRASSTCLWLRRSSVSSSAMRRDTARLDVLCLRT